MTDRRTPDDARRYARQAHLHVVRQLVREVQTWGLVPDDLRNVLVLLEVQLANDVAFVVGEALAAVDRPVGSPALRLVSSQQHPQMFEGVR